MSLRATVAIAAVMVLGLAGCATESEPGGIRAPSADATPPDALVGVWRVERAIGPDGAILEPEGSTFTMEIDSDGNAAGQAACNSWNASVAGADADRLRFGAIGLTRAGCGLQGDARAFEQRYVNDLTRTMQWSRSDDTLVLRFQDGQEWELSRSGDGR